MEPGGRVLARPAAERTRPPVRLSALIAAVWIALLVCLALTIADDLRVRSQLSDASRRLDQSLAVPLGPVPGDFSTIDAQGRKVYVPAGKEGRPTIAFVASSGCLHCAETMKGWQDLTRTLANVQFVLMGVDAALVHGQTPTGPGAFDAAVFSFPQRPDLVWTRPSPETVVTYRLKYVPQTIVVRDGRVVFVKTGKLDRDDLSHIRQILGSAGDK